MSFYKKHIFFCTNLRDDPSRPGCAQCGAQELRNYAKSKIKALNASGAGNVRVNTAGCLDRCESGPVCVVYPEGIWYQYFDQKDIDMIVDQHLINGNVVESLKI